MTSAWYEEKIAPDGDVEDGCNPVEAATLEAYLTGKLDATDAARKITRPVATSTDPDYSVATLWVLLMDALTELTMADVRKVITLLQAVQDIEEPVSTAASAHLWPHLHHFGDMWGDELRRMQWRDYLHSEAPRHCSTWEVEHIRTAGVEALMVLNGLGNIPLSWGLVDICDALESSQAILDIEVPAVAEWFSVAGTQIYKAVLAGAVVYPTAMKRDLWRDEGVLSLERWSFWHNRLTSLRADASEEDIGVAADRILACMAAHAPGDQD